MTSHVTRAWSRFRQLLPHGNELPDVSWRARHRFILGIIALHVPALAAFGALQGWHVAAWVGEPLLVALLGCVAALRGLTRRLQAGLAGLALVTSSAILVQFSGGYIEAHFHYFIVVALVALYEDYVPFLLAISYVAFDHGVIGSLAPSWVYNHPSGAAAPWQWALVHAAAILGESVALLGFWMGAQQVRQQAQAQERAHRLELERLVAHRTAQLTAANRELEAFSYTVSHDLRSPLRAISGFAGLLQRRHAEQLTGEARQMLGHITDGVDRMEGTIDSLLSLASISRAEPRAEHVDLSAMAQEILEGLAGQSPRRRVAWTVEPGLQGTGEPGLLRLALENLLGNAWKFTAGTKEARIRFRRDAASGAFVVDDNGAGFDPTYAGNLFKPFHRLHLPSQFPGTGIGLATVDRIVRRHGGAIWAEGGPGQGARFFFTLPESVPEVTLSERPTPSAAAQPTSAQRARPVQAEAVHLLKPGQR